MYGMFNIFRLQRRIQKLFLVEGIARYYVKILWSGKARRRFTIVEIFVCFCTFRECH